MHQAAAMECRQALALVQGNVVMLGIAQPVTPAPTQPWNLTSTHVNVIINVNVNVHEAIPDHELPQCDQNVAAIAASKPAENSSQLQGMHCAPIFNNSRAASTTFSCEHAFAYPLLPTRAAVHSAQEQKTAQSGTYCVPFTSADLATTSNRRV